MTDAITPAPDAEAPKVDAPVVEAPKSDAPADKATITPEIQAIIDRVASDARKEGRESALKKLEVDDSAARLKEAQERIEKLEARDALQERALILAEFQLDDETLSDFAEGLTGPALRARAEKLSKLIPRKDEGKTNERPGYQAIQDAAKKIKSEAGTLSPQAQAIAARAAKLKGV